MSAAPDQPRLPGSPEKARNCALRVSPRARRFPFVAVVELTELQSDESIRQTTTELSLFGCRIIALKPFSNGRKFAWRLPLEDQISTRWGKLFIQKPELAWQLSSPPSKNTTSRFWKSGLTSAEARMLRRPAKYPVSNRYLRKLPLKEPLTLSCPPGQEIAPKLNRRSTFKIKHITSYWSLLSIAWASRLS